MTQNQKTSTKEQLYRLQRYASTGWRHWKTLQKQIALVTEDIQRETQRDIARSLLELKKQDQKYVQSHHGFSRTTLVRSYWREIYAQLRLTGETFAETFRGISLRIAGHRLHVSDAQWKTWRLAFIAHLWDPTTQNPILIEPI